MPIAIVVNKCAAGVPANLRPGLNQACLLGHVGKLAVAVIPIKSVLTVIGDEQIVPAVVVVIAHAAGLSPTGFVFQAGAYRNVCKCSVAIVFEQPAMRLLAFGEAFETPAIDHEEIDPAILIVVIESQAAAGGFKQVLVVFHAAINGYVGQSGLRSHFNKADAERRAFNGRLGPASRRRRRLGIELALLRPDPLMCCCS